MQTVEELAVEVDLLKRENTALQGQIIDLAEALDHLAQAMEKAMRIEAIGARRTIQ